MMLTSSASYLVSQTGWKMQRIHFPCAYCRANYQQAVELKENLILILHFLSNSAYNHSCNFYTGLLAKRQFAEGI
jgi:hypothetical protein